MAQGQRRRRKPPRRSLIAPLLMLGSGVLAGAVLWRVLMLGGGPVADGRRSPERLTHQDRQALENVLEERGPRR